MSEQGDLSALPGIDRLLADAGHLVDRYGHRATTAELRATVEAARARLRDHGGAAPAAGELVAAAADELSRRRPGPPRAVLNATGVVVHTNLGRAPLSEEAREALLGAAAYCDLEYDLARGVRGSRGARLQPLVAEACAAEDGLAVNNAASALVLALATLAAGREVLVSRGELVEIGGSFRLPEILAASGARLHEVGTTNRTRASDYAEAGGDVAAILRVHPSNYRITGFTEAPSAVELAAVAEDRGVPLLHDVGSGLLEDRAEPWLADEPSMAGALRAGADLAICSGDKLLGGPQAGLLAGRRTLVRRCAAHPLARAVRLDKLRIAALTATLEAHLREDLDALPTWAMLTADPDVLAARCRALAETVGGEVVEGRSLVGGGAAPGAELPTPVLRARVPAPEHVAAGLRTGDPPVVVRVDEGAIWVDLRTVPADADPVLTERLGAVLAGQQD